MGIEDMKINWKDFVLMYPIGFVMMVIGGLVVLNMGNQLLQLLAFAVFVMVPGLFYFYRNKHEWKGAAVVSVLFGFTLTLAYIIVILALAVLLGPLLGNGIDLSVLGLIDWGALALDYIKNGVLFTIPSLIAYVLVRYVKLK